jgi:hypothetical protein
LTCWQRPGWSGSEEDKEEGGGGFPLFSAKSGERASNGQSNEEGERLGRLEHATPATGKLGPPVSRPSVLQVNGACQVLEDARKKFEFGFLKLLYCVGFNIESKGSVIYLGPNGSGLVAIG